MNRIPTLKDTSGSIWTIGKQGYGLVKDTSLSFGTSGNNIQSGDGRFWLKSGIAGHAGRGYTGSVISPLGTIDGDSAANVRQDGDSNGLLSIDSKGRLWFSALSSDSSDVTSQNQVAPTVTQDSDDIEFTDIAQAYLQIFGQYSSVVILLGKPRTQTPTTVINQMPTTGAPEGLSTIGLIATGVGLAGIGLMLARRRD